MNDWKLIALDMDGTLLQLDGSVSEENRHWIRLAREAGIEVTLATGRMMRGLVPLCIEELNLTVPVVTVNGGEVWSADGQLLRRRTLTSEDIAFCHELATEYKTYFWACSARDLFGPDEFPTDVTAHTWVKFGLASEEPEVVEELRRKLTALGRYELTNSHPKNIEINPQGVTKASGLEFVCEQLGIHSSQVVAMGDSMNDIPMLAWAGLGIAMENAQAVTKEAADRVTAHHMEHGVARAIEALLRDQSA